MRASRDILFNTILPELLINIPTALPHTNIDASLRPEALFNSPDRPVWFEIGFGGGEHLAQQARLNPEINFIGCEPYINGMASLLVAIDKHKLSNIRLYDGDARLLLEKLPDSSVERIFVLFPDPWPKARHHKKRLISEDSLELFRRKLKINGLLRIATDHEDYCTWMLENIIAFGKFKWLAESQADWNNPPSDWVVTRYQQKAEAQGRKAVFIDLVNK